MIRTSVAMILSLDLSWWTGRVVSCIALSYERYGKSPPFLNQSMLDFPEKWVALIAPRGTQPRR
jgi:hypothetical protein